MFKLNLETYIVDSHKELSISSFHPFGWLYGSKEFPLTVGERPLPFVKCSMRWFIGTDNEFELLVIKL